MPGKNYTEIGMKLRTAGITPETPCAIISRATTHQQRTYRTTVRKLGTSQDFPAPTLLVVGDVVRFADPASLANEFVVPMDVDSAGKVEPAALFADFPYQRVRTEKSVLESFEKEEELLA